MTTAIFNLASLQHRKGDHESAERSYRESLAMARRVFGAGHYSLPAISAGLAFNLAAQQRHDEAEALLERIYSAVRAAKGEDSREASQALRNLVRFCADWHGCSELSRYRESLSALETRG